MTTLNRAGAGTTRRRKVITLLASSALLLAVTLAGIATVTLTARSGALLDLTAAGEQQLAPRTRALLDAAREQAGDVRIVVVGPVSTVPQRVRQEARDVLDLLNGHPAASVSFVDTAAPTGADQYRALLDELSVANRTELDAFAASISMGAEQASELAAWLTDTLSPRLGDLQRAQSPQNQPQAAALERSGALARTLGRELSTISTRALESSGSIDPARLAGAEAARLTLSGALASLAEQLLTIATSIEPLEGGPELSRIVRRQRDQAAVAADALARLAPPPVVRAARALQQAEGVLLLARERVAALFFEDVFSVDADTARTDLRRTAESALASGIAGMLDQARPIVVLIHAENAPILPRFRGFDGLIERLGTRGIDVTEWPGVLGEAGRPDLTPINPLGSRPVVYATLSPDSISSAVGNDPETSGPARARRVGALLESLLQQGAPMLLSLNPSVLPGAGSDDPMVAFLRPLGIDAATGTPIFTESNTPMGRLALVDATALASETDHPLARALRGLPTSFTWPVPVRITEPVAGVRTDALYALDVQGRWAESEWIRMWTTDRQSRPLLQPQPSFDPGRDDQNGPWTIAVAVQRQGVEDRPEQRLVVVGSNGWFTDAYALSATQLDGRMVLQSPGNSELFEASVLWLAGKDAEVVPSAQSRAVPLVKAYDDSIFRWLRWGLIAGLPVLVLLIGGIHRMIFG